MSTPDGPSPSPTQSPRRSAQRFVRRAPWLLPAAIEEGPSSHRIDERDLRYQRALVLADVLAALLALLFCGNALSNDTVQPASLAGLPLVVLASRFSGLYSRDALLVRKSTIDEAPALFHLAAVYTLMVYVAGPLVLDGTMAPRQALVLWASLWLLTLVFRRVARHVAAKGSPAERLLLVGDAGTYARIAAKLDIGSANATMVGRLPLQRVTHPERADRAVDEFTLRRLLAAMDADRVLVAPAASHSEVTLDVVRAVKGLGLRVSIVPDVLDVVGNSVVFDDLYGITLLGVRDFRLSRSSRLVKRYFDLVGAGAGVLLLSPFMALIAVAIRLDSGGPVLFRQERVGQHGRRFGIIKFRTMVPDAEARKADLLDLNESEGLFKMAEDPRITRVGRLLRRTSLDELPQLFNVLRGEMSLVGPRPLITSEDERITGHDRRRLDLTPGMTGPWQVMGSARIPLHEMVKIDYLYVTTWTLFADVKILVRTVPHMLARRGA